MSNTAGPAPAPRLPPLHRPSPRPLGAGTPHGRRSTAQALPAPPAGGLVSARSSIEKVFPSSGAPLLAGQRVQRAVRDRGSAAAVPSRRWRRPQQPLLMLRWLIGGGREPQGLAEVRWQAGVVKGGQSSWRRGQGKRCPRGPGRGAARVDSLPHEAWRLCRPLGSSGRTGVRAVIFPSGRVAARVVARLGPTQSSPEQGAFEGGAQLVKPAS